MKELNIIYLPPGDLTPYAHNAKRHPDDQVEHIANSIREFGFRQPIVVDADNVVVIGHGRLLAAKKLGLDAVPVVRADDLTEAQIKALRLADNKTNESEWDFGLLDAELVDLALDFDMSDFGFDEIPGGVSDTPTAADDDFDPDEPVEPKAKIGDIYQLGRHRLMCGDSTDVNAILKLLDGRKADIVFTDPPYLIETEGGCKGQLGKSLHKQGKEIEFISNFDPTEFLHVLPFAFNGNMNAYIFCNKELLPDYLNYAKDNRWSWNVLVWKKPNGIPIGDSHRPDIEYLILYRKNAIWNNGTNANYSRCLEFSRVKKTQENGNHPTIKPVELIANELIISSNTDSICLDFFGGSGSTLIACEQLNRICYMMELDPHYVDVIIARWEKLTGEKAILLNE